MNDYLYSTVKFIGFPDYIGGNCKSAYSFEFLEARNYFNNISSIDTIRNFLRNYKGTGYVDYENFARKQLRGIAKEINKTKFSNYLAFSVSRDLVFIGHLKMSGVNAYIICEEDIKMCERRMLEYDERN